MKIEKDIPLPPKRSGKPRQTHHSLDTYSFVTEMEIGDSFKVKSLKEAQKIQAWIHFNYNIVLTQRQMPDGTVRIWRIR